MSAEREHAADTVRVGRGIPHYERCDSRRCACYQEGWRDGMKAALVTPVVGNDPAESSREISEQFDGADR